MSNKLNKSNQAHQNSYDRYNKIYRNTSLSSSKSFWADVKRDYHSAVLYRQKSEKKF